MSKNVKSHNAHLEINLNVSTGHPLSQVFSIFRLLKLVLLLTLTDATEIVMTSTYSQEK